MAVLAAGQAPAARAGDFLERVWLGEGRPGNVGGPLTVLGWNIERGQSFPDIIDALEKHSPDVALLQEVDLNARRTGRKNIAEDLARHFQLHWAFGVEFQELGQGSGSSPAYVGQAVLSRLPIREARILRFEEQSGFWRPRWWAPNWGLLQRRRGGRMALVAELEWGGGSLIVYTAHLESRGKEDRRLRQIEEIVADASKYPPDAAIVVAGDFNTRMRPSPVIARLREAGFRQAAGSETSTSARGAALDWIFVRGRLACRNGEVLYNVQASDHYPLKIELSPGR